MGWDMQPSRIVTVFQGLNCPFLPVSALGFYSGMGLVLPLSHWGCPHLPPAPTMGCNPLYNGSEEHFGVSKEGVSMQPHSRVQPSQRTSVVPHKSWHQPAVNISGLSFSR